ncbi:tRNA (N6-threonylcarbamoyladenosine(37)-N6)-methyltransferase TrmO [Methanobrevibacter curvatus]|uniref:Putative tRNA (Adenine(37)-N6)-methyltransferase n=1 Tax=Methanobrevibacter curvatus TaxID=49547 RepID=A0A166CM12_9EURY|nr:tRNA (N6-threonylcarbamoyladenosine(37)-N6)-methyltransferase TrmO [Methanobrevibacter curvatus]KZX14652.1 putative tRNA (adenine(37)-N6)-methyltransferase [Methanobrevibacter curvatus]
MNEVKFQYIGKIKSPFNDLEGMPIQPVGANGVKGEIHLNEDISEGLKDITGFSHLTLIYHLHKVNGYNLQVKPFLDNNFHGIFATRSPKRPNPIGLSVVKLNSVEKNILYIENVDVLNNTPLLDIKPYVPHLYGIDEKNLKIGWFKDKHQNAINKKSDDRFIN